MSPVIAPNPQTPAPDQDQRLSSEQGLRFLEEGIGVLGKVATGQMDPADVGKALGGALIKLGLDEMRESIPLLNDPKFLLPF